MSGGGRRRGEPLLALALILTAWIGARAVAWTGPAAPVGNEAMASSGTGSAARFASAPGGLVQARFTPWPARDEAPFIAEPYAGKNTRRSHRPSEGTSNAAADQRTSERPALARSREALMPFEDSVPGPFPPADMPASLDRGAPRGGDRSPGGNAAPFPVPLPSIAPAVATTRRWSGDAWFLARSGGGAALATGLAPATYGGSQAGAILRYALAPASRYRPAAYARVSGALGSVGDTEAALGLSARPLPALPLIALGELRATRSAGRTRLRPAAMLVTQLPPFALPTGFRGEIYAQGGYVAGAGATPFADGQLTLDHGLARIAGQRLRIGGGAWGGAQRGAARFDVGPSALVDLRLDSRVYVRIALDYRLRVAGNAAPRSGPALTASAGF